MIVDATSAGPGASRWRDLWARAAWPASLVVCGVLPAFTVLTIFVGAWHESVVATDFHPFYRSAEAILHGQSPYPSASASLEAWARPYVYPPLPALVTVPLTVISVNAAGVLVMACGVLLALATPFVLGVRDWRCFGIVLLWPPVISAIQSGNPTLLLVLAAALVWRYRDRTAATAASVGLTFGVKYLLWPLVVWLAATRRYAGAVLSCVLGAGLILLSWAAIGFSGLSGYPGLLHRLDDTVGRDAYTTYNLAVDLGAPSALARGVWLALGLALLVSVIVVARRGDDRGAFILAIAAALSLTPLIWLHYFSLLMVVVAIAQPELGPLWFLPLAMFASSGNGHPSLLGTVVALSTSALTIALALRAPTRNSRTVTEAAGDRAAPEGSPVQSIP